MVRNLFTAFNAISKKSLLIAIFASLAFLSQPIRLHAQTVNDIWSFDGGFEGQTCEAPLTLGTDGISTGPPVAAAIMVTAKSLRIIHPMA